MNVEREVHNMWKKAYKFLMNTIIVVGSIITLFLSILSGVINYSFIEIFAITLENPDIENIAMVAGVISGLLTLAAGAVTVFMSVIGMGFVIEIADDIEQIRINTTPKEMKAIPKEEQLDVNKYIYPYQYNNVYNRKDS